MLIHIVITIIIQYQIFIMIAAPFILLLCNIMSLIFLLMFL